jgi:hypothetical protein
VLRVNQQHGELTPRLSTTCMWATPMSLAVLQLGGMGERTWDSALCQDLSHNVASFAPSAPDGPPMDVTLQPVTSQSIQVTWKVNEMPSCLPLHPWMKSVRLTGLWFHRIPISAFPWNSVSFEETKERRLKGRTLRFPLPSPLSGGGLRLGWDKTLTVLRHKDGSPASLAHP